MRRVRRALLQWVMLGVAVATAAALALSGASNASVINHYTAAISSATVVAGAPVTLTITNSGPSDLGAATFALDGSALDGTSANLQAPSGKSWTVSVASDTVTLSGDALAPGEAVSVDVIPTKAGEYTADTSGGIDSSNEDYTLSGGEPSLTVQAGPVAHFVFGDPSPAAAQAGVQTSVPVTAFDQYDNPTDSVGPPTLSSTMNGSPVGCPGPCSVTLTLQSFADGASTLTFTPYQATMGGQSITLAAGSATDSFGPFAVAPGPVDHFEFGTPSPAAEAGVQSTVLVTAFDQYENPTTDSLGTPVWSSTLHGAPDGSPENAESSVSDFAPGGTATFTFTAYKAEPATVTVTAGNSKSSTSAPFDVRPGPLAQFAWTTEPGSEQTAGVAFGAAVTSFDQYGNVKTDYNPSGTVTVTGLGTSPSAPAIFGSHPGNDGPTYGGLTWTDGVGTLSGVVDKDAETAALTITSATPSVSETSNTFTVAPASPDALAFTQQPLETQIGSIVNATTSPQFVAVQAIDPFGNLASNTSVSVAIGANPGSGTLGGTTTRPTDANGIATFDDLTVSAVGVGYTLSASAPPVSPTATKTSNAFIVAQTVSPCTSTCTGAASAAQNTLTVSATGTSSANALGITLAPATIPAGVCPGFADAGPVAGHVDVSYLDFATSGTPTLRLVWVLDKSIVHQRPDNSAAAYDICLGSVNLLDPQGSTTTGFPTKSGAPATKVFDPVFGVAVYWGLLPDCTKRSTTPCVSSRSRKSGDEVVTFDVQYPWDPTPHLG